MRTNTKKKCLTENTKIKLSNSAEKNLTLLIYVSILQKTWQLNELLLNKNGRKYFHRKGETAKKNQALVKCK